MEAAFVAIFSGAFVAIFMVSIPSEKQKKAARDKRMAEHRMNARLLRLNI